jgi:DegV family protein with EDD domain
VEAAILDFKDERTRFGFDQPWTYVNSFYIAWGGEKMPEVAILTDSVASLPETIARALNIHWVAYYIHRGTEVLRDLVTIQREEFLRWLEGAKILPTTASPGPGDYLAKYEQLADEGVKEIASIHMTSKASGAYQAARVAQSMAQERIPGVRIEVIDTRCVLR